MECARVRRARADDSDRVFCQRDFYRRASVASDRAAAAVAAVTAVTAVAAVVTATSTVAAVAASHNEFHPAAR